MSGHSYSRWANTFQEKQQVRYIAIARRRREVCARQAFLARGQKEREQKLDRKKRPDSLNTPRKKYIWPAAAAAAAAVRICSKKKTRKSGSSPDKVIPRE